jgi:hypothetical protein
VTVVDRLLREHRGHVPLDLWVEALEDGLDIAAIERFDAAPDSFDVPLRHLDG